MTDNSACTHDPHDHFILFILLFITHFVAKLDFFIFIWKGDKCQFWVKVAFFTYQKGIF